MIQRLFLLVLLCLCGLGLTAQNNLQANYKNSASVPDFLNICGDPDRVVVTISTDGLSGQTRDNIQATLNLFEGVSFFKLDTLNTTFGVILTSTTNPSKPRFSLPDLSPNGVSEVDIAFYIAADCGYTDTLNANNAAAVFDTWDFTYDLGTLTGLQEQDATPEYRTAFKVPVLTMAFLQNTSPPVKVGDCYTRELRLANSALQGFVDTVFYTNLQGAGVSINELKVNGIVIPFTKTLVGTDTLVEAIIDGQWLETATIGSNPGNGDEFLDPNESVLIEESICVVSCTSSRTSVHTGSWGCKGERCNDTQVSGFSRIGDGSPNAVIQAPINDPINEVVGYCKPGVLRAQYSNNGSQIDPGFATMSDLEIRIGMTNDLDLVNDYFEVTGIRVAGVDLAVIDNTIQLGDHPQFFMTDPDGAGGLTDEDGDGYYDDLATGNMFDVIVYYQLSCDSLNRAGMDTLFLNEFNISWNTHLVYTNACAERVTKTLPSFGAMQSSNEEVLNCIDADAYPNMPFLVQHIETRGVRNFTKDCGGAERFVVWTLPPPGVTIDPASVFIYKNNSTFVTPQMNSYVAGDTLFVEFDASNPFLNGKYDVQLEYTPDCTVPSGRIAIPFGFMHYCPGCDCRHTWYSKVLEGPQFHPTVPPCPTGITCPQGMQAVNFDVERSTFGFTDATYTTPMNPADANRNVAIHCDSVQMTLNSVVGGMALTDSIGIVISYDNVEGLIDTNEIFLFGNAQVRINSGGMIYLCALDSTDLIVIKNDTTKTLFFDLSKCLTDNNLTLQPGDSVNFVGNFMLNPDGPMIDNFRKVPNFRAYSYATIDGAQYACDNFGKNFFVSKIPTVFATPGGNQFPSGCSNSPFSYRLITKNIGFSNLYGNEHYPAIHVDSLVLEYDTTFLDAFSNMLVEVSIPGHPVYGNDFYEIPGFMASDSGRYVAKFDTLMQTPAYNIVQSYSFNLRISVSPGCESLTGSSLGNSQFQLDPTLFYTDRYFAKFFGDGSCAEDLAEFRDQNLTYSDPPTISFDPITNPNHLLTADTAVWEIKQCNTSTKADANGTWLAARFDTTVMELISFELVDDPNNPVNIPVFTYDNGKVFAFTPGVLRQATNNSATDICNTIRIKAIPRQCGTYPMNLSMGWNCAAFDTLTWTPDDYACNVDTIELSITTVDPSVDATVVNQPATFPSLCDTVSMELLVRNTGQGTMFDVLSQFSIPLEGATLLPMATEFAYPSDAPFQPVLGQPDFDITTPKGKFYKYSGFDSLNLMLAQNGLPGFDPINPNTDNEFKIRYKFVTDCDFKGGVLNFYAFSGVKICGDPSNLESGESLPINFQGLTAPADKSFDVALGAASLLANGDTSTLQIMAINLMNTPSDTLDQISIKLPAGVEYIPNSSIAIQPSWMISEPNIATQDSIKILTWTLPPGLVLNDTAIIDFKVLSPALSCSGSLESALATTRVLDHICGTGGFACESEVITTSGGEQFFSLSVGQSTNFAGADVDLCPGESVQLNATGNFQFYEWMPATGLSDPQSANPTANPSMTTTYSILATDSTGCVFLDELTITVTNNLALTPSITDATCGADNGAISFSVSNGSGMYDWAWSSMVSDSSSAMNLAAGTYDVTVSETGGGCSTTSSATVAQNGIAVTVNLTANAASSVNPNSGSINVDLLTGQAPFSIMWSGPVTADTTNINSSSFEITGLSQGDYTVTITDASGCSTTEMATVIFEIINNLDITAVPVADSSCCTSNGFIIATGTGGDGNYTFTWTPNVGIGTNLGNGQYRIDSLPAGVYTIFLEDGLGNMTQTTATVEDACVCADIFPDDVVLEPSGVEAICIPIPYNYIQDYPIIINNQPYPGPFAPCDFDTIVAYSFSFVTGYGFDGPYQLNSWTCNNVTIQNAVFNDIFELADSMNVWDPFGFWYADPYDAVIYGGDYDQFVYGEMDIVHMPSWTPFILQENYTEFAYGTNVFVNPFDGKAVVTAYDSTTCCTDSVCVIFINPCEDLIPLEPFVAYSDDPNVCIPIEYDSSDYHLFFVDGFQPGILTSCDNGDGTSLEVTGGPGIYEFIAIDTLRWCADTVPLHIIYRPLPQRMVFSLMENTSLPNLCLPTNELLGFADSIKICTPAENGMLVMDNDSCLTYTPNANFVGIDSCCVEICDNVGVCDTTYMVFNVIANPVPSLTTDTLYFITPFETMVNNVCGDVGQLLGGNMQLSICNNPINGTIQQIANSQCVAYEPASGYTGSDWFCLLVCDDMGFCDTTYVNVLIESPVVPPTFTIDTLYLSTPMNVPIMNTCMDLSEIGTFGALGWCPHPSGATGLFDNGLSLVSQNCFTYFPSNGFTGVDSACVYVCNAAGECDTTYVYILVEDMPDPVGTYTNTDTLYLSTPMNIPITGVCVDTSELVGNLTSIDICGGAQNGLFQTTSNQCISYTPMPNYLGFDEACVAVCDDMGVCDTTYFVFLMTPGDSVPPLDNPMPDSIYLTTQVNTPITNICLDESELMTNATSISLCQNPLSGQVQLNAAPCLEYNPDLNFEGNDAFCAYICDGLGRCDTTYIFITVENNNPPNPTTTPDTLYLTTPENTTISNICLNENELTGNAVNINMCGNPANGQAQLNTAPCLDYIPNTGFVGVDSLCSYICDASGLCDTTYIYVTVGDTTTMNPLPTIDTLNLTTSLNIPIFGICLDESELTGSTASINLCTNPINGSAALGTTNCLDYTPNTGFVGMDSFCVYICDATGLCDTTYIFVTVDNPSNPMLTIDTLNLTTPINVPIFGICLDESELNGNATSINLCANPMNGVATLGTTNCLDYTPNTGFIGVDSFCTYICDAMGLCDTTYIFVTVEDTTTTNPMLTIDTLYVSTEQNLTSMEFCLDTTELTGNVTSFGFCNPAQHGTVQSNSLTCLQYIPDMDYVGLDTACVFICDDMGVCDTTYIFFLIKTPNITDPSIDTIYLSTMVDIPILGTCVDTTELTGTITSINSCGDPVNGQITFNQPNCFDYLPNTSFIGMDSACVSVCDDMGICDTTYVYFMVTPLDTSTTGPSMIDTIYVTTDFETISDTFCISPENLMGAVATSQFCILPQNGQIGQIGDTCFTYLPTQGFVGNDTSCVVYCDAANNCDTTIIVFTVLPADVPDCGFFSVDSLMLEILPGDTIASLCMGLPLDQVPAYTWTDNGQPYSGGFMGCDFDTCFAYNYFTFPDLGAMGPYLLDFWVVDGDTISTTFQNVTALLDSMNVWDPGAGWTLNTNALTIESCTAPSRNYGNMRVIQLSSAGSSFSGLNVNLVPNGTSIHIEQGQHSIIVEGQGCADTLWVNVMPATFVSQDTFIYVGSGQDTICLSDLGIGYMNTTDIEFICQNDNGTHVDFNYDATTGCIYYDGLLPGQDQFCMKLSYGMDSCLYFTFTVTALEDIPCTNFIVEDVLTAEALDCMDPEALICIDVPYAIADEFDVFVDGVAVAPVACPPNASGTENMGVMLTDVGIFEVIFMRTAFGCVDTVSAIISCAGSTTEVVEDTILVNTSAQYCIDTSMLLGNAVSMQNICAFQSGAFVNFTLDTVTFCVTYDGLTAIGTEPACIEVCDDMGFCDTTLLVVTVIDEPGDSTQVPPVAVVDYDTIYTGVDIMTFILNNDTLNMADAPIIIVAPTQGTASILADNSLLYIPNSGYCNSQYSDSLQYLLCNDYGCDTAWVYISVPCQDLVIYDGFSPNGDGANETFWMEGLMRYNDNDLRIYNRWGNMVYQTENYIGDWEGTWDGSPLPDGTYFYIFNYGEGRNQRASGYVVIRR